MAIPSLRSKWNVMSCPTRNCRPVGFVLLEPAFDRQLLQIPDGLRGLSKDTVVHAVETQRLAETPCDPLRAADLAVVAVCAGVLGHGSLAFVEMVQQQRVVVRYERCRRVGSYGTPHKKPQQAHQSNRRILSLHVAIVQQAA